ncbi:MAG: GNAT family N-acetyltransferase [Oscillospiraceae bacterium]|nr:GNAT family N-acetyltransferase [Oscillospiraceae bacterium]
MIRTATAYDILALKKIWDSCFSDPINYIDFVFDRLAKPEQAVVCEENGEIVSMLLMIDTEFVFGDETAKAVYILGAATAKQHQNRGYMTYLLDYAENLARSQGVQLAILVPGEQYLYSYYKKRGYNADFNVRRLKIKRAMLESVRTLDSSIIIDRISPSVIADIREHALSKQPHVRWNTEKIKILMEDSFIYGDHVALYQGEQGRAYAFFRLENRKIFIKESLGSEDDMVLALVRALMSQYRAKGVLMTLPTRSELFAHEGEVIPYGMSKPLHVKTYIADLNPYMNLMFD